MSIISENTIIYSAIHKSLDIALEQLKLKQSRLFIIRHLCLLHMEAIDASEVPFGHILQIQTVGAAVDEYTVAMWTGKLRHKQI